MTLPCERTRAVIYAKRFLQRLASPYCGGIKGVRREVREEARRILRHYPHWFDLGRADCFDAQTAVECDETTDDWLREIGQQEPAKRCSSRRERM